MRVNTGKFTTKESFKKLLHVTLIRGNKETGVWLAGRSIISMSKLKSFHILTYTSPKD